MSYIYSIEEKRERERNENNKREKIEKKRKKREERESYFKGRPNQGFLNQGPPYKHFFRKE